ncbi:16S rRNA (guanine(527)-N(7))-methyltransferase RsmG [Bacillus megaterium]|nr:16S rRNA (guanine(527)-N(7))-methyltransferase RsmG [Priestia megaterium]
MLVEWNEKMNLTAITDKPGVYVKHFFDSVSPAFYYDFSEPFSLCDVGAGAGIPEHSAENLFSALARFDRRLLQNASAFCSILPKSWGSRISPFITIARRRLPAEKGMRESFDVVTARAVARMPVLAELCLPLVKVGGTFIAMKAASAPEELKEGKAIAVLGGEVAAVKTFTLPFEEGERTVIFVHKRKRRRPNTRANRGRQANNRFSNPLRARRERQREKGCADPALRPVLRKTKILAAPAGRNRELGQVCPKVV